MKQLQFFNHKPSIWYNRNISITLHVLVKKDYHNRKLSYRCFHSLPNIQKVLSANVIQSPIQIFNRIIGTVHSNHHWRCICCSSRCCHHNHIPYRRSSCPKNVVQTGIVLLSVVKYYQYWTIYYYYSGWTCCHTCTSCQNSRGWNSTAEPEDSKLDLSNVEQ